MYSIDKELELSRNFPRNIKRSSTLLTKQNQVRTYVNGLRLQHKIYALCFIIPIGSVLWGTYQRYYSRYPKKQSFEFRPDLSSNSVVLNRVTQEDNVLPYN